MLAQVFYTIDIVYTDVHVTANIKTEIGNGTYANFHSLTVHAYNMGYT